MSHARVSITAALASVSACRRRPSGASDQYVVRNLVSSSAVVPADRFDPNLKNPWGLVSSPTSPWWPANNGTNTSTIMPATGAVNNTVVAGRGRPDRHRLERHRGRVPDHRRPVELHLQHDVRRDLRLARGHGVRGQGPGARRVLHGPRARDHVDRPAALRRRLQEQPRRGLQRPVGAGQQRASSSTRRCRRATAPTGSRRSATGSSSPTPQQNPAGGREIPGAGKGYVSAFDLAGNFLARVASGGVLNAPWGTAQANPNFGAYGGDLLIGNFGDGRINAFHENADGTWTPSGHAARRSTARRWSSAACGRSSSAAARPTTASATTCTSPPVPTARPQGLFGRIIPNPSEAGGTVPATLSLAMGTPASFGAFTPGVGKDYTRVDDGQRDLQRR